MTCNPSSSFSLLLMFFDKSGVIGDTTDFEGITPWRFVIQILKYLQLFHQFLPFVHAFLNVWNDQWNISDFNLFGEKNPVLPLFALNFNNLRNSHPHKHRICTIWVFINITNKLKASSKNKLMKVGFYRSTNKTSHQETTI